jgi:hypothetical protein
LSIGIDFGIGIDQNSWYRTGIVSKPKKLVSPITTARRLAFQVHSSHQPLRPSLPTTILHVNSSYAHHCFFTKRRLGTRQVLGMFPVTSLDPTPTHSSFKSLFIFRVKNAYFCFLLNDNPNCLLICFSYKYLRT